MVLVNPGVILYDANGNVIPQSALSIQNLKPGVSYVVQVQAVDAAGKVSDWSVGYTFVVPNFTS